MEFSNLEPKKSLNFIKTMGPRWHTLKAVICSTEESNLLFSRIWIVTSQDLVWKSQYFFWILSLKIEVLHCIRNFYSIPNLRVNKNKRTLVPWVLKIKMDDFAVFSKNKITRKRSINKIIMHQRIKKNPEMLSLQIFVYSILIITTPTLNSYLPIDCFQNKNEK